MDTLIKNCRYLDSASGSFCEGSVGFADGVITHTGDAPSTEPSNTVDAGGSMVIPGLIDCYARLREPGYEKLATIATETNAAKHSAITTIMCSPDTDPVTDEPAIVELIKRRAAAAAGIRVLPIGAATIGQQGEQLGELRTLADSGCVAFSNGDHAITNTQVMRRLMEYSSGFGLKLIIAPQDPWLSDGVAHEGSVATRLGFRAIPAAAETVALSQLIELCYQTGADVHFSRLSSHRGVQLVSQAKKDNIKVTADVGIDHLFLTEMDTSDFNSMSHTSPPFRSRADLNALREGIATGVIDAICSNHAPHETDSKLTPFPESSPGTSSLDSFLGLLIKLADETSIPLATVIARATSGPADCFALNHGRLEAGRPADAAIIDSETDWEFTVDNMHSQGKNSPYEGWAFQASPSAVFVDGRPLDLHR
jgi:dihydroorotase